MISSWTTPAKAAGVLRPGNAGANTAADHIAVLDAALAIPDAHCHGTDILTSADSADSAGGAKAFLTHVRALREQGIRTSFSVGYAVIDPVRRAIRALPDHLWHPALEQDGTLRTGAEVAELTGMVDLADHPDGTRIIVRRPAVLVRSRRGHAPPGLPHGHPSRRWLPAASGGPSEHPTQRRAPAMPTRRNPRPSTVEPAQPTQLKRGGDSGKHKCHGLLVIALAAGRHDRLTAHLRAAGLRRTRRQ
ncbi:hypothetical protein ACFU96_44150 [Streptomyces sp. NPDC057620]|uniref:hypothetical protein n=1 Tax=Streptomyces sp. NPDC057620 TaxID=3346185 RepID=UPI00368AED1E